ncbi:MAG: twin-arginine translocase TatA/TatE family subunit [Deltaproteobacteria bacterium]|nr:twin-arginine translocase TatA/TatE family subunit [Deltaproteobacteria bacterium]MBW2044558.1 twin-arginine translocase TatA/TatE family subunit [Deltaproteobacteria bacterium]MBW2299119.1 twin-arginine translocase TatA/TatE family subunit [Deltaproteobacteria bacterium]
MFGLGGTELLIILIIVFLIFGAKRLPEIGKGLGGAIREFKQVKKDIGDKKQPQVDQEKKPQNSKDQSPIENKLAQKVIEQAPGAKKVLDVKKKVEKVKDIID